MVTASFMEELQVFQPLTSTDQGKELPEANPQHSEALSIDGLITLLEALYEQPNVTDERILSQHLELMEPEKLDEFLSQLAFKAIEDDKTERIDFCLKLISFDKLQGILRFKSVGVKEIRELARKLAENLPQPLPLQKGPSLVKEATSAFSWFINLIPNLISTFSIAFSLFDIGKEPQSAWEASAMLEIYYKFIMIPAAILVIVKVLLPFIGLGAYAVTGGVIALLLLALFIYIKWLRPCPSRLPHASNLTDEMKGKNVAPVIGRENEIQRLITLFSSMNHHSSRHALLVGPTGVGKTEIINGLTQRIIKGEVPDGLKNKNIFVVNTASLIQGGMYGYADQMSVLMNRIKGYENEVIFFFEEVHAAMQDKSSLSNFLKPLFDRGKIHCIAATTEEEFNKHVRGDTAFVRRFERIDINPMSQSDTKRVLQDLVHNSSRGVRIEGSAYDKIYKVAQEKMPNKEQPAVGVEILTNAIKKVSMVYDNSYVPPALKEKEGRLASIQVSVAVSSQYARFHTVEGNAKLQEIELLKAEIAEDKKKLSERQSRIERFRVLVNNCNYHQQHLGATAKKSLEMVDDIHLKQFFVTLEYLIPQMENRILKVKESLKEEFATSGEDFSLCVDDVTIEKVVEESLANNNR